MKRNRRSGRGKPDVAGRQEAARALAIVALGFIASDTKELTRFLALTGIDPGSIRIAAEEPGFLAGVLGYISGNERTLLAFAAHASVLLASEDSQIGVRMRVCLYGQDRTHRSSCRRSGAACETGERSQHAAEDRVAVADRAFGRRGDWRGRGGEEGGQERAHRAPLAATLRGQGGGGVVEGRDPPGRAQAADSEENQTSREPDAQREAVGRHPLERTHDGGTGWHRAVVGT